jgi:hypothetical protein
MRLGPFYPRHKTDILSNCDYLKINVANYAITSIILFSIKKTAAPFWNYVTILTRTCSFVLHQPRIVAVMLSECTLIRIMPDLVIIRMTEMLF